MTLPRAHGGPQCQGEIKSCPADFQVFESMQVVPDGEGEHLWLHIEKTGWNTEDVALLLAKQTGIHRLSVGYSGLKDKQAITRQWFSLHLPGKDDPPLPLAEGLQLLDSARHRRKLNRGTHRANRFLLRVRALQGDRDLLEQQLAVIAAQGVPNYFGEQRFGRGAGNFARGQAWLAGQGEAPRKKSLRSFWLSAVRSAVFNDILAERVRQGVWNRLLDGDILQPEGSRGLFLAADDEQAAKRVADGEVHPTAPLPGRPGMASSGSCWQLEQQLLQHYHAEIAGLCREGLEEARRATRLPVTDLQWQWLGDDLQLSFSLPAGAFATTVLAELVGADSDQ